MKLNDYIICLNILMEDNKCIGNKKTTKTIIDLIKQSCMYMSQGFSSLRAYSKSQQCNEIWPNKSHNIILLIR